MQDMNIRISRRVGDHEEVIEFDMFGGRVAAPAEVSVIAETLSVAVPRTHGLVKVNEKGQLLPDHASQWAFVLDTRTNLMWTACNVGTERVKQPEAEKAATALRAGDFTDWRLPTRAELLTIVDDTRSDPAINTDYFRDCVSNWYWTSTPYAGSPAEFAWVVDFSDGAAYCFHRDSYGFVRAVRSVRAPSQ